MRYEETILLVEANCSNCIFYDEDIGGDDNIIRYCMLFEEYIEDDMVCYECSDFTYTDCIFTPCREHLLV